MPDITEILNTLSPEDKQLYTQHRTEMRRSYMTAHNSVLGIHTWSHMDDMFLDLIDMKLALLFDKSGRAIADKPLVTNGDAKKLEDEILAEVKSILPENASQATKAMMQGWNNEPKADWMAQVKQ